MCCLNSDHEEVEHYIRDIVKLILLDVQGGHMTQPIVVDKTHTHTHQQKSLYTIYSGFEGFKIDNIKHKGFVRPS